MKYPKVKDLVPAGEHFDESAIVNEGGFLSVAHLDAIENQLTESGTAYATLQTQLDEANANGTTLQTTIEGLNTEISGLKTAATASANTINTQQARITALEAENAELGGQSSGTGTALVVKKDEVVKETNTAKAGVYALDDPNHPQNQIAAKFQKK